MAPLAHSSSLVRLIVAVVAAMDSAFALVYVAPMDSRMCSWPSPSSPSRSTCPLPIDDEVGRSKGAWGPWSHRPYCVEPANKDVKYCLYTMDTFRGHGLSVITAPDLAASLTDAMDDAIVREELRDHPSSVMSSANNADIVYERRDLPGRGKGMVTRRRIRQWEVVMVDFPAIIAHVDTFDVMTLEERQRVLQRAIHRLPVSQRTAVMGLARSHGKDPLEDLLKTNAYGVEVDEALHMALFIDGSVCCA